LRKIIYVSIVRLTDKMAADWHVDYLIDRGQVVEYWDIVSLVREEHSEVGARTPQWLHRLKSFEELEARLLQPENRDAFYVMLLSYAGNLTRVFRLLSKHDCRMLTFASGLLPRDPAFKWRKIVAWLIRPYDCLRQIFNQSMASYLRRAGLVKPFAIAFAAGTESMNACYASRIVPINFFDYDRYREINAEHQPRLVSDPYVVFLDSNLPYHTDLAFVGCDHIDGPAYYRSLNRFFALIEHAFARKVVIAAHPRADYGNGTFDGRAIYRSATAQLVRDADFVLVHGSTAVSYAVLNRKPLVFIYTDGMLAAYKRWFIRSMQAIADCLDCPVYNIDRLVEARQLTVRPVNVSRYEEYKYRFLTSRESENTPTQEIVWRTLNAS
jgi:hypothetical protein